MTKITPSITYESYLNLPKLLSLQHRLSPQHDEWQFMVVHQAYELWFRLMIIELNQTIHHIARHEWSTAAKLMRRINLILKTMITQTHVLESMSSWDFSQFRPYLGTASGFDSWQFREVEKISGLDKGPNGPPKVKAGKRGPAAPVTLREAWLKSLIHVIDPNPVEAIIQIYRHPHQHPEHTVLLRELEDYEEQFALWRNEHARLAERMIGVPTHGTGGSGGVSYLDAAARHRFFPELNEARSQIMAGKTAHPN